MTRLAEVFRGRLLRLVAVCLAAYVAAALLIDAPTLILVLNDLVLSCATGVCIAYAPVLPAALIASHPTRGEYLGSGIFFVSACMLLLRIASAIARDFGRPEIYNSNFVTLALGLGLIGALKHLWAPHVKEDGRIPPARWLSTGIFVAVGLFIALGCWTCHVSLTHPTMVELR